MKEKVSQSQMYTWTLDKQDIVLAQIQSTEF